MKTVLEKSSVTDIPSLMNEPCVHWLGLCGHGEKFILADCGSNVAFVNSNNELWTYSDTVEKLLKDVIDHPNDHPNTTVYSFGTYQERHNWFVSGGK